MSDQKRTFKILSRLPHFYEPAESQRLIARMLEIFARRLESTQVDLYSVMQAHHIDTADNPGSEGYLASVNKRGSVDLLIALYLEKLGGTSLIMKMNPRFTRRSLDVPNLTRSLLETVHPLQAYIRSKFSQETWHLLERYHVRHAFFRESEITPEFVLFLVVGRPPLGKYLYRCFSAQAHGFLGAYDGGREIQPELRAVLLKELNEVILRKRNLYRDNCEYFESIVLSSELRRLLGNIEGDFVSRSEPLGDDLVRLNRLLLEAAFSSVAPELQPRLIPDFDAVQDALTVEFDRLLDDDGLFRADRFPDMAEDYSKLRQRHDTLQLNRILLESAFANGIEKSHAPYRNRMLGLIQVLRRGAATRQGVLDIVAANLGIVERTFEARAAKAQIEIEEFLPQRNRFFEGALSFYEEFTVENPAPVSATPILKIHVLPEMEFTLVNAGVRDVAGGSFVRFPGQVRAGETLVFRGATVTLDGLTPREPVVGELPLIAPGKSIWRFEAEILFENGVTLPGARFDFPLTTFGESVFFETPAANVELFSHLDTPGVFVVTIPWHIPGYTDSFAETEDHPRHQIQTLVNRVKAAGVLALVRYSQAFVEDSSVVDRLGVSVAGSLLQEAQTMASALECEIDMGCRAQHDVQDTLSFAGRFDYTEFESLNRFA